MTYRTIFLQLVEDEAARQRIAIAARLAKRFAARLEGMHVSPPPIMPFGYGEAAAYVGPEIIETQREANKKIAERLGGLFEEACREAAIDHGWRTGEGDPAYLFSRVARTGDLALCPQVPVSGVDALAPQIDEQLIMELGGPVLMLPADVPADALGRRVVAGWNGSREAVRAIREAMPFLQAAETVHLVTIGDPESVHMAEMAASLRRHDLNVKEAVIESDGGEPGKALLDKARAEDANLLVMGAYGHSRLRELVLGGATRHVLQEAGIPVLFAN